MAISLTLKNPENRNFSNGQKSNNGAKVVYFGNKSARKSGSDLCGGLYSVIIDKKKCPVLFFNCDIKEINTEHRQTMPPKEAIIMSDFYTTITVPDSQAEFTAVEILVDNSSTGRERPWREKKMANEMLSLAYE